MYVDDIPIGHQHQAMPECDVGYPYYVSDKKCMKIQ